MTSFLTPEAGVSAGSHANNRPIVFKPFRFASIRWVRPEIRFRYCRAFASVVGLPQTTIPHENRQEISMSDHVWNALEICCQDHEERKCPNFERFIHDPYILRPWFPDQPIRGDKPCRKTRKSAKLLVNIELNAFWAKAFQRSDLHAKCLQRIVIQLFCSKICISSSFLSERFGIALALVSGV